MSGSNYGPEQTGGASVLNKLDGTTAPGVGNDASQGYAKTSIWIDAVASPAEIYCCVDDTVGAAIWIKTTLTIDELGSIATQAANNVAITGGAINGTTIGGTTPAAVTVTTLATGLTADRLSISGITVAAAGAGADVNIDITPKGTGEVNIPKVDIDGGTIDGVTLGATSVGVTAASGTNTTHLATTAFSNAAAIKYSIVFGG